MPERPVETTAPPTEPEINIPPEIERAPAIKALRKLSEENPWGSNKKLRKFLKQMGTNKEDFLAVLQLLEINAGLEEQLGYVREAGEIQIKRLLEQLKQE